MQLYLCITNLNIRFTLLFLIHNAKFQNPLNQRFPNILLYLHINIDVSTARVFPDRVLLNDHRPLPCHWLQASDEQPSRPGSGKKG